MQNRDVFVGFLLILFWWLLDAGTRFEQYQMYHLNNFGKRGPLPFLFEKILSDHLKEIRLPGFPLRMVYFINQST